MHYYIKKSFMGLPPRAIARKVIKSQKIQI